MGNPDRAESIFRRKFDAKEMGDYFVECALDGMSYVKEVIHPQLDKWEMDLRMLKYERTEPYEGAPNFSSDVTMTMADSITPRLIQDLFDYNEPIDIEAVGVDDEASEEIEAAGRKLMAWDANSSDELRSEIYRFVNKAVGLGISFAYTFGEKIKEVDNLDYDSYSIDVNGTAVPVIGIDPQTMSPVLAESDDQQPMEATPEMDQLMMQVPGAVKTTTTIKTWRWKSYGPKTICAHTRRVFWSPDAESLEDAFNTGYVGIELSKTAHEIMTMLKMGEENDTSKGKRQGLYSKVTKAYLSEHLNKFKEKNSEDGPDQLHSHEWTQREYRTKKMQFVLIFGRYDVDNDNLEEPVAVLCHPKSRQVLGWEKFPYDHGQCPIVEGKIKESIEKQVEGVGVAEMNFDDKGYIDKLRNDRAIARERFSIPRTYVKRGIGFNRAKHNDGEPIWEGLEDIGEDSIKTERVSTYDSDSYQEESNLIERIQARFGLPNPAVGMEAKSDQTLGGLIRLLEEGAKSRDMYKKRMAQAFQRIFYQRYRIWKQYLTKDARRDPKIMEFIQRVLGEKVSGLDIESMNALDHNLNVTMRATHDDKRIRLIKALDKYKLLSQEEMVMNHPYYRRNLIKDVLIAMGDSDVDESLPEVEEYQEYMMNIQKQAMVELEAERQAQEDRAETMRETERNIGAMEAADGDRPVPEDLDKMEGGVE